MTATALPAPPAAAAPTEASGTRPFAGFGILLRSHLRQDRVRAPVWILSIALMMRLVATNYSTQYSTPADLQAISQTMQLPAAIALAGPYRAAPGGYTVGALVSQAVLGLTAVVVALMSLLTVIRHTRAEEEAGRTEMLRASVVGRRAGLSAAVALAAGMDVVLGLVVAVALASAGVDSIDVQGSLLFGASLAAVGLVFTGVAAVTAQLSEYARGAAGLAGAVLGVAYALRAIGDVSESGLSWLSPIGWAQATETFVADRWWPLAPALVAAVALVAGAAALDARRDLGAGLFPPRPGRPGAAPSTATPLGLAVRLQRASVLWWSLALIVFGLTYGSILSDAQDLLDQLSTLQDLVIPGSTVSDSLAATMLLLMAIIVAVQGVLAVLKLRREEASGRAEQVLATSVGRSSWAGGHLAVALGGTTLTLVLGGLAFGIGGGLALHDASTVTTMVGSALAYLPPVWVTIGVAMVAYGFAPRLAPLAWVVIGWSMAVFYAQTFLDVPSWVEWLSPFSHVPLVPAEQFEALPLVVLTLVAVALLALGLGGLRRRGIPAVG